MIKIAPKDYTLTLGDRWRIVDALKAKQQVLRARVAHLESPATATMDGRAERLEIASDELAYTTDLITRFEKDC